MIAPKKRTLTAFPRAKIERVICSILPEGESFELKTEDSGINQKKVVRVITPAWRTLRNAERISRLLKALDGHLSDAQQDRILRFSVLTPKEFEGLGLGAPPRFANRAAKRHSAKKAATKRKVVRKAKRALAS
jgi:hypothetical protein